MAIAKWFQSLNSVQSNRWMELYNKSLINYVWVESLQIIKYYYC